MEYQFVDKNIIETRYEVINRLIEKRFPDSCNYLEIGVRNPDDCFNLIRATNKTSVDPGKEYAPNPVNYKMTSDEFFSALKDGTTEFQVDKKWDVIFIDGLHIADQCLTDVLNALQHLTSNGLIVLHDCSPPMWYHSHSDVDFHLKNSGEWSGTIWKTLYWCRVNLKQLVYTIDTDFGIGIIDKSKVGTNIEHTNTFYEFHTMSNDRKHYLGLISVNEFMEMEL